MELIADDRERAVIKYLRGATVKRITTGDYAFMYNGVIIMIIERKTLADLAASIKDGRMNNNDKLIETQQSSGCKLLYIIEGPSYPKLTTKFNRIPYKCLQGKLDSLMFRHNINIIHTKDAQHTAERLMGLSTKLTKMVESGDIKCDIKTPVSELSNIRPVNIDTVHIKMVNCIPSVSYKAATIALQKFKIHDIMLGNLDQKECYNLTYDSGVCFGVRGENLCKPLTNKTKNNILACIKGITVDCAAIILSHIKFEDIINNTYEAGAISDIKRNNKRIGIIEDRIRLTFYLR